MRRHLSSAYFKANTNSRERDDTLARGLRLPMASALKSFLFFLHSTAVMMIIISVTTAIGANTAAIIHRLLGGFLTTAEKKRTPCDYTASRRSASKDNCVFIDWFIGSIIHSLLKPAEASFSSDTVYGST